jgi:hypothetical protein
MVPRDGKAANPFHSLAALQKLAHHASLRLALYAAGLSARRMPLDYKRTLVKRTEDKANDAQLNEERSVCLIRFELCTILAQRILGLDSLEQR